MKIEKLREKFESEDVYVANQELLNPKLKYLFDNYDNERTLTTYWGIFKTYILEAEKLYNKDLYRFNKDEIENFMLSIPTSSKRIKNTIGKLASLYITWALQIERLFLGTNPFDVLDFQKLIAVNKKSLQKEYYSFKEIFELCKVAQEKNTPYRSIIVVLLARMGIVGESAKWLLNLKEEDIDRENHVVNIIEQETGEIIQIDIKYEEFYYWLDKALAETIISEKVKKPKLNGESRIAKENVLNSDGKVMKSFNDDNTIMSIYPCIKAVFEANRVKPISLKKLVRCAKFDDLVEIAETKGYVDTEDFRSVQRKYSPEASSSSYYTTKQDFMLVFPEVKCKR